MSNSTKSNRPHLFLPKTAKKLGIVSAVVESAIHELGWRGPDNEAREVMITEVLDHCWYLSENEVFEAYSQLKDENLVTEEEK